jgi:hypothetical protein
MSWPCSETAATQFKVVMVPRLRACTTYRLQRHGRAKLAFAFYRFRRLASMTSRWCYRVFVPSYLCTFVVSSYLIGERVVPSCLSTPLVDLNTGMLKPLFLESPPSVVMSRPASSSNSPPPSFTRGASKPDRTRDVRIAIRLKDQIGRMTYVWQILIYNSRHQ